MSFKIDSEEENEVYDTTTKSSSTPPRSTASDDECIAVDNSPIVQATPIPPTRRTSSRQRAVTTQSQCSSGLSEDEKSTANTQEMQVVRNNNLHQDDYSSYLTLLSNLSDSSEDEDLHNAIMASLESEK